MSSDKISIEELDKKLNKILNLLKGGEQIDAGGFMKVVPITLVGSLLDQ